MQSSKPHETPEPGKVVSPFAHTEASVPQKGEGSTPKFLLWVGSLLVIIVVAVFANVFLTRYLHDPYRTLERFPIVKLCHL